MSAPHRAAVTHAQLPREGATRSHATRVPRRRYRWLVPAPERRQNGRTGDARSCFATATRNWLQAAAMLTGRRRLDPTCSRVGAVSSRAASASLVCAEARMSRTTAFQLGRPGQCESFGNGRRVRGCRRRTALCHERTRERKPARRSLGAMSARPLPTSRLTSASSPTDSSASSRDDDRVRG